jgi:hypothetical protein
MARAAMILRAVSMSDSGWRSVTSITICWKAICEPP